MKNINGKIDLHIHTTASDGSWEPEYVVKLANDSNVGLISITDHDDISNVLKTEALAQKNNISFLKGVEISSLYDDELFHILGYGIDVQNQALNELLDKNRYELEKKDTDFIKLLINKGYNINFDDYEKYEHKTSRGGWKALSFLIDAGLCKDVADFFNNLYNLEPDKGQPDFKAPENVIKLIKAAGGIPILAHPYYTPSEVPVSKRLGMFYDMGIEGFECYHPNHNKAITEECLAWCRANKTIITSGSDCHGDFIKTRHIGVPECYIEDVYLGALADFIM